MLPAGQRSLRGFSPLGLPPGPPPNRLLSSPVPSRNRRYAQPLVGPATRPTAPVHSARLVPDHQSRGTGPVPTADLHAWATGSARTWMRRASLPESGWGAHSRPRLAPGVRREDDPPCAPHPVGARVLALGHEFQQDPASLLLPGAGPGQIPAVEARQPAERHRHRDESLKRWAHRGDQHTRRPKVLHWQAAHVPDSAQRVLPGDAADPNPGHALVADVDAREP